MTNRIYSILATIIASASGLLAQAEGESPYSSSTVDTPTGGSFFADNGLVIVAALIFFLLILFVVLKGRRRA
ncbi:hypothetical protein GGR28_001009 [Lewinella aquimaris]|uniref:Uncharacterized protein n=1 Tax=Neolewinella aquimaris TaxID=1835722 RepID=A0A840EBP0_9BACT|nr:hypothetical protein [Neolewinella aquimaris]MBB4078396.1 hypothetical protein [Neolewinella aquimaris]